MLRSASTTSMFRKLRRRLLRRPEEPKTDSARVEPSFDVPTKPLQIALQQLATNSVIYSGDLDTALRTITEVTSRSIEVERVSVWFFETTPQVIRCLAQYNLSSNEFHSGRVISIEDCPQYFRAIAQSRVVAVHDVHSDNRTKDFRHFESQSIASMLDAPVHLGGELVGIVSCVELGAPRVWTEDEQKFVGSVADMVALACEVNERKRVEQELRESREFLRTVLDTAPSLIWVKSRNGTIAMANQALADLRGLEIPDLEGKPAHDHLSREEAERYTEEDVEVLETQREKFIAQEKVIDCLGRERWLQTIKRPLFVPGEEEPHVLGVAVDITQQMQLENQLRQSQKVEAIGQLAGGVAHDFNNLLNGVLGYASLLKHRYDSDPEIARIADRIEQAGQRAQQLTEKLIGFARQGKHQNVPVDVHAAIEETVQLLQRTIETNITLIPELYADSACALGDPVQIQQIILNLAINARDAMSLDFGGSEGGQLTIGTKTVSIDGGTPDVGRELEPGEYLLLTVSDSGCGIAREVQDKIFDPFFTTKKKGKGTGMGLSMVLGIVQNHGGAIRVRSQKGVGTTFLVYLPSVEPADRVVAKSETETTSIVGKGLVLLVDDDEVTRDVTADMLETLGYEVMTANDGSEAVDCYRQHFHQIDAIILDMVMPKMGGRECFRACKNINPNVRAILTTGYDNNHSVQSVLNEGMVGFVQKPYSLERLSEEVAHAISLSPAPRKVAHAG